jgi:cytochrome d ubiquinol oxidase subunit I
VELNTLILSRAQFGFTIGFHILFPTLNLGMAVFLAIMEGAWVTTQKTVYLQICKFWTKIFALTFGMGVVSGIVLAYELGTNFGPFIAAAGSVLGPLFAYEVLSAFFLEAGFLGIMLFGWNKVGPKLHYLATLLVMIGTTISAFWIMSANSWMQTPAGYHIDGTKFVVDNWWHVVFNPSFLPRFIHMVFASYVTTCFVIAGVSAWYLLKQQHLDVAKRCYSFALAAALILTPTQIVLGDLVGVKMHEYQPLKTAAMEGLWQTMRGAPLLLFAIPDVKDQENEYELAIPHLASLLNTHEWDGELQGLKSVAPADRPLITPVFFNFRIMVGIGFLLLAVSFYGFWLRLRGRLYDTRYFLNACVWLAPIGFVSTIAGWLTAEMGRQPWIIFNLMRTMAGASMVPRYQVMLSSALLISVYGVVFSFYLYYLFATLRRGPEKAQQESEPALLFHYLSPEEPK